MLRACLLGVGLIAFASCSKGLPGLFGHWERVESGIDGMVYKKVKELPTGNHGFTIRKNGEFRENANAGWCGTPPIHYEQYDGQWEELTEQELAIEVGFWGGTHQYVMRLLAFEGDVLRIETIYMTNKG